MATNVQRGRRSTRLASRRWGEHVIEQLEKRACPAAVAITGPAEIDETAGTGQIVVALTEQSRAPVTVSYSIQSTASTAAYGRDYRLFLGRTQLKPTGTLTFRPGQTSQVITMPVFDDTIREGNESFTFSLQQARGATLNPAARTLTVTIKDNDNYTVSIVGPRNVNAGATIEYALRLSSPATQRETFYVSTRDGSARVTQDYRPLSRVPVTILPGQSSALVRVVTVPNVGPDYDRIFFLDVVPATPGFPAPTPFPVTIRGVLGPIPPSISIADMTVLEGATGTTTTANFVVTLSTPFPQSVSVDYTSADGTATAANNDYIATSGTLTFAPGEMSKTVSVTIVGDNTAEQNETFQLILSGSTNAFVARSTATGLITNDDGSPTPVFQIVVVFPDNSLTASQRAVFLQAAGRWSQIIVGDLPDVTYQGRVIDDVEIVATAPRIDGVGGILGQAGPTRIRTGGDSLPYLGQMEFDSADVGSMVSNGSFTDVILHEMGHVLGFGTLWNYGSRNLVQGVGTSNPVFVGANAVREYQTMTGTLAASIPIENTGGEGTAGGHWRESVFSTELMTGYAEAPGVPMPISRMTVGALQDLGYTVDYAAADPFTLNARQAAINFQLAQLPGAPGNRLFLVGSQPAASLFAAVAFMDQLIDGAAGSVATRAFRALGAIRG